MGLSLLNKHLQIRLLSKPRVKEMHFGRKKGERELEELLSLKLNLKVLHHSRLLIKMFLEEDLV